MAFPEDTSASILRDLKNLSALDENAGQVLAMIER